MHREKWGFNDSIGKLEYNSLTAENDNLIQDIEIK